MIDDLFKAIKTLRSAESLADVADVLKREWERHAGEAADAAEASEGAPQSEPRTAGAGEPRGPRRSLLGDARALTVASERRAEAAATAVEARLLKREKLDGADVAAAAWLAGHRGDLARARILCSVVPSWEKTPSTQAVAASGDWLALDATARCDWDSVAGLAPASPVVTSLQAIAQSRPELAELKRALKLLRADKELDPAVARAVAAAVAATRRRLVTVVPRARAQTPIARATALHMAVLGRPPETVSPRLLARLARSWDGVFADPATARQLGKRAVALGGGDAETTLDSVRETVVADLAGLVAVAGLAVDELADASELLQDVADQVDSRLADELSAMVAAMDRRTEAGERLPTLECVREWVALRGAYERWARLLGLGGRMAAFELVYHPVANQAAGLWNKHGLRRLPNAMFSWLAAEAELVGRSDAATLQGSNKSW